MDQFRTASKTQAAITFLVPLASREGATGGARWGPPSTGTEPCHSHGRPGTGARPSMELR